MNIPSAIYNLLYTLSKEDLIKLWEYLDANPSYQIHKSFESIVEQIFVERFNSN